MTLSDELDTIIKANLVNIRYKAVRIAKRNTPVDIGNLKLSVKTEKTKDGFDIIWGGTKKTVVYWKKKAINITYGYFVDLGTSKQIAQDFRGKTIRDIKNL